MFASALSPVPPISFVYFNCVLPIVSCCAGRNAVRYGCVCGMDVMTDLPNRILTSARHAMGCMARGDSIQLAAAACTGLYE